MTRRDRPKKSGGMNPKITYVLLGLIFVVMALIIVSKITTEPELEPEVVTPAPEATPPVETTPSPSIAQRQPVKAPAAPKNGTTAQKPAPFPATQQPDAPAQQMQKPAENQTQAASAESDAGKQTAPPASANETAAAPADEAQTTAADSQAETETNASQQTEKTKASESQKVASQNMSTPASGSEPITPKELNHENTLRLVTVEQRGGSMILKFQADQTIGRYKYFTLNDPPRLVVDLIGEWEQKSPGVKIPKNELFKRVRFGRHENKIRIVADLVTPQYTEPVVVQDPPTELVVSLRKK